MASLLDLCLLLALQAVSTAFLWPHFSVWLALLLGVVVGTGLWAVGLRALLAVQRPGSRPR